MRPNSMRHWNGWKSMLALLGLLAIAHATPASAQLTGNLRYLWGYTLVPDPPLPTGAPTVLLYGDWPTGCGEILEASVSDTGFVTLHLRSTTCTDTGSSRIVVTLPLVQMASGRHTLEIELVMERPDTATATYYGSLSFEVAGGSPPPPPPPGGEPPPPPPPPTVDPLVTLVATDPYEPTPDHPMALIVGGRAPFGCPVVTAAAVVDTSHLTLTLAPTSPCSGDSATQAWSQRFELGLQREGYHTMSLAIVLSGGVVDTVVTPVHFLVFNDSTVSGPPPDSLANQLSANRPNPFAQVTRFSVSTDTPQDADVGVFDILGRRVSRVFHGRLPAGTTQLAWNGFRDDGERAVAGVYFYRLEMSGRVVSRRLILLQRR